MRAKHSVSMLARLLAAALGIAMASGLLATALGQGGNDPTVEPVPRPEYVDDARSFVAGINFSAADAGTAAGIGVFNVATPGTEHLNRDVIVSSEVDGQVVRSTTMPNPAMSFADGFGYFFQAGRYEILAPFDPRVETIRLSTPDGATIATVETASAVREFCIAHPDDPGCLEADLSVDSVHASGPRFAVVGEATSVSVSSSVSNKGPDGPVDAVVTRTATPDAGLAVSPAAPSITEASGLAVGESRTLQGSYSVTCTAPGTHTIEFSTSIAPKRAWVVDPEPTNDRRTDELAVDCAIPITINIQPGSEENPVNLNAGALPVAVLTTRAGEYGGSSLAFDATTIDVLGLRFGSESALLLGRGVPEVHGKIHPEDSLELDEQTRDGDLDAVLHFKPRFEALGSTDTQGCVFGRTTVAGRSFSFFGCDDVGVKP